MREPAAHYLVREPAIALPLVALALNVVLVVLLVIQTSRERDRLHVAFTPASTTTTTGAAGAPTGPAAQPLLEVKSVASFTLDGEPLTTIGDLEFRLSARATPGAVLRLAPSPTLDAESLARVLRSCVRAGFASVAIEPPPR